MENQGSLLCTDSNELRIPRLEENLTNLGVNNSQIEVFDWTKSPPSEWHNHFDAILLDVPCSNTGVLRRRVDARWRISPEQIEELTQIQTLILQNALTCLKPEGRLVYSTCSIESEENEELVAAFAESNQLQIVATKQSLPHRDQQDGAFATLLKRRAE